ncbi:hypothetical protein HCA73_16030 [Listeria booriae]|uniref:hypothetical protein n=1 Tax=Listeria booriae TaxID=1552123 RepID=UPI001625FA0C|nr:hypothetical protein [Listeria booriae]MBC1914161.1 hypothetical protein [Listeria booriae]
MRIEILKKKYTKIANDFEDQKVHTEFGTKRSGELAATYEIINILESISNESIISDVIKEIKISANEERRQANEMNELGETGWEASHNAKADMLEGFTSELENI